MARSESPLYASAMAEGPAIRVLICLGKETTFSVRASAEAELAFDS